MSNSKRRATTATRTTEQTVAPAAPKESSYSLAIQRLQSLLGQYGDMGSDAFYNAFSRVGYGLNNEPFINNMRVKAINPLPADYTKEELGEFLLSPQTSELPLRKVAESLKWTAYPVFKLQKSYADMPTYHHYVKPLYIEEDKAKTDEFLREWRMVDKAEKAFCVEDFGHQAAAQALLQGKVFYVTRSSLDKVHNKVNYIFHQQLPTAWSRIIGFNNISKYTVSFDMMYFLQPATDYRQYGDLFEPFIRDFENIFVEPKETDKIRAKYVYATVKAGGREYHVDLNAVNKNGEGNPQMYMQNGRWCYFVSLPIDRVWTFEIDDSTAIAVSPFAGLFQTFAQQADYEAAQLSLIMNPLIKIFTGEIPYFTTDGSKEDDGFRLSDGNRKLFEYYWNVLMRSTNTGGTGIYFAPAQNIKSHDFAEAANANEISSSFLEYGNGKTGLSALIPTVSNPHAGQEEYSAKLESRFADRVYRTLEKMFNHLISTLNLKYEWEMTVFGSVYNDSLIRTEAIKLLDKGGLEQHFILAALDNMSVLDKLSLSYAVKGCGLLDMLIPPATSYTQSATKQTTTGDHESGANASGAPTKTEAEIAEDKTEKETTAGGEAK